MIMNRTEQDIDKWAMNVITSSIPVTTAWAESHIMGKQGWCAYSMLRQHDWTFARRTAVLHECGNMPEPYSNSFWCPDDALLSRRLYYKGTQLEYCTIAHSDRVLVCADVPKGAEVTLDFTSKHISIIDYPDTFERALVTLMACEAMRSWGTGNDEDFPDCCAIQWEALEKIIEDAKAGGEIRG